ncbi:MAG: TonB family protein [Bacteroidota bacterium]
MQGDSLSLVHYILEKERKEKARKRRVVIGIVLGVAILVVAILIPFQMKKGDRLREFSSSDLTMSQVSVLFQQDPSPLIVTDEEFGRIDTIFSAEDYAILLTAIRDGNNLTDVQESGNYSDTPQSEDFRPYSSSSQQVRLTDPLTDADIMPNYPGGEAALYQFLSSQIRYPPAALENKIEGKVFVRFVINPDGSITKVNILRGIGYGCDEEALRVVRMMPRWIPGEENGQKVPVYSSLAVNFKFL